MISIHHHKSYFSFSHRKIDHQYTISSDWCYSPFDVLTIFVVTVSIRCLRSESTIWKIPFLKNDEFLLKRMKIFSWWKKSVWKIFFLILFSNVSNDLLLNARMNERTKLIPGEIWLVDRINHSHSNRTAFEYI